MIVRGPGGEVKSIAFLSPFLPYNAKGTLAPNSLSEYISRANTDFKPVQDAFKSPADAMFKMPVATKSYPEFSFAGCPELHRSSIITLAQAKTIMPALNGYELDAVMLVPEYTSPWTFAGVGAALCNTYLGSIVQGGLDSEEKRAKFRRATLSSISSMLASSVNYENMDAITNSSPLTAASIEYADGYRAATIISDRVTDVAAQAEGAKKVYISLQKSMPEFFPALPSDRFLSADEIAEKVEIIGKSVSANIATLRADLAKSREEVVQLKEQLKVRDQRILEIQKSADDYKKSIEEYNKLLVSKMSELEVELRKITSLEDLKKFQEKANAIIDDAISKMNQSLVSAFVGLKGLINTVISVSSTITANMKLNAQVSVNMCSVGSGNQK